MSKRTVATWLGRVSFALSLVVLTVSASWFVTAWDADAQTVRPPAGAVTNATPPPGFNETLDQDIKTPGGVLGSRGGSSDSDLWRAIREGDAFTTQKRGAASGVLVQSEGSAWREMRDGPLATLGLYLLGGMICVLALFYLLRGRIRIEHGRSTVKILRFNSIERFGHWLLASSFIVLGVTGLTLLYGKPFLIPLVGKEAFAAYAIYGKLAHNTLAFAFMTGLAITFVTWVAHNIPQKHDLIWLAQGGGLFSEHLHPPSRKFNAGQKLIFWSTMLLGLSLCLSGWALLFPFEYHFFGKTFETINMLGFSLPTDLTPMQEMQLSHLWHGLVAKVMIAVIIAHIYIGSVGMEGAFDAMGSGEVDLNWAREHHGLWVEEMEIDAAAARAEARARGERLPAE